MADKKQVKVYLIPEGETRDHHTYHYTAIKTRKFTLENKKMRMKKFNPAKRVHEWFVEAKIDHNKYSVETKLDVSELSKLSRISLL